MKKQVTLSQIITGTLYYFDFVNSKTLGIIINDFLIKNPNYEYVLDEEKMCSLSDIINYTRLKTTLKQDAKQDPYIYDKLKEIAGPEIEKYFKEFNTEEFMLRKLNRYNGYPKNIENTLFTGIERKVLASMKSKKYIKIEEDENPYKVVLSSKGKAKLYMYDHYDTIIRLQDEIKRKGYNPEIIEYYLAQADLSKGKTFVLDINKIQKYADETNKTELKENNVPLDFTKLNIGRRSIFDDEGWKLFNKLITINDNEHRIKIADPRVILEETGLTYDKNQKLIGLNWEELKEDFEDHTIPDVSGTVTENLITPLAKGFSVSDYKPVYLAVVEEYSEENTTNYLVRGIVRKDTEGYAICFNPEFEKTIPHTIEERVSRLSGKNNPKIYKKKQS